MRNSLNNAKSGQRINVVYRMKNFEGSLRWIHDTSMSIQLDGEDFLIEGIASDITANKNFQNSIQELNKRYDTAMKASSDAIWEYDGTKDKLILSKHFFNWIDGYTHLRNLKLDEFRKHIHPEDQQKLSHLITNLFNSKFQDIDVDLRIHLTDNQYKWFNLKGGIIDLSAQIIAGSISEIHLRKQNEQELLKAKSLFSEASKLAKLGAWELDFDSGKVKWSDVTYQIHDIEDEERKSFNVEEAINFYSSKDKDRIRQALDEAIHNNKSYDEIYQLVSAKGKSKWVRCIAKVEFDQDTRKRKIFGIIQDITQDILFKEKQNNLLELTKNQNSRLKNFAYIVSHNLRSHASNFSSLLNLFKIENLDSEDKEIFEMLNTSSSNLLQTIEDLSKVAGLYQKDHVDFTKVSLKDTLIQVINSQTGTIKENNITLHLNIDKDVIVKGLPSYVESIFFNLVSNAIKYANPTKDKWLRISLTENKKHAIIQFEDNGLGIDLKTHGDDVFKMYKIFHRNTKGSRGLGLFITKNQIEFMKGKIDVKSHVGKGSTFTVYFKKMQ
ncbi:MAG: PAS domain-containing protein [Flavobacteriaceae bacterium]|nr:PAS domain-containing protein [Flavobacteriaceae bacterium]